MKPLGQLLRLGLTCVTLGLWLAAPLAAQQWVGALSEQGRLSLNGMQVERLTSSFKVVSNSAVFGTSHIKVKRAQRWWDLTLDGNDRYALRQDGKVSMNGARLYDLNFGGLEHDENWVGLAIAAGDVWALRGDGRVSRNGTRVAELGGGSEAFRRIASDGAHVYHLRSDGAVFQDDLPGTLYRLAAGSGAEGDGVTRTWRALAIDTVAGRLYALRADGKLRSAALDGSDPEQGVAVAALPFSGDASDAKVWVDLALRPGARWLALRGEGVVRGSETEGDAPLASLPGSPNKAGSERYMRIVAVGDDGFAVLRRDGRIYTGSSNGAEVNLRKGRYRGLAVTDVPPVVPASDNLRPRVATWATRALEGRPLELPVLAVDVDMPMGEPEVSVDADELPDGVVYDAARRALLWAQPSPGNHRLPVTVSDGVSAPVRVVFKVRVQAADEGPHNHAPELARLLRTEALARQPFELPVLVVDRDGDPVTVTLDEATAPDGMLYDAAGSTLLWTPTYEQLGRHRVRLLLDDGTTQRVRSMSLRVRESLRPW